MSRTKPNYRRVWGTRPLRTVGDRRKARPHGADARDYAAGFRVFKVPVGRILLSHVGRKPLDMKGSRLTISPCFDCLRRLIQHYRPKRSEALNGESTGYIGKRFPN